MSEAKTTIGAIAWTDLTVPNADTVRDFYAAVVGWEPKGRDMGGYDDYEMLSPQSGETQAGICWARGANADLPATWLVYINVEDLDASVAKVTEAGGSIVQEIKDIGEYGRFCVIKDPAGAVSCLYEPAS
ncbi:MAG: VOC family protein [Acidobacteriota bacterium]